MITTVTKTTLKLLTIQITHMFCMYL